MSPDSIEIGAGQLRLRWPDGDSILPAAALRAACRCAHCRAPALNGQPSPFEQDVELTNAEPVGHYALQLTFSDGHTRGIYPWAMLRELGSAA